MPDIGIFDVLSALEKRKIVTATEQNVAYCDCDGVRHFRQWYRIERTGDSFYICTPKMLAVVNYVSGHWGQMNLTDLVNHLLP